MTDRAKLVTWLSSLRNEDGSFTMHRGGEVDIRGVYCALSAARQEYLHRISDLDKIKNL